MLASHEIQHPPDVFPFSLAFEKNAPIYRKVLVPFADVAQLEKTVSSTLPVLEAPSVKFVLLRVCNSEEFTTHEEDIYSELRGIQAQLQIFSLPATIDTVIGPTVASITSYVESHDIDLVLVGERMGDTRTRIAEQVTQQTQCETLVV